MYYLGSCDPISVSLVQGESFRIHSRDSRRAVVLNLIMNPSHLGNLLEYRFLSPNTQSFCLRIQKVWGGTQFCTYKIPGNADAIDLGTTL